MSRVVCDFCASGNAIEFRAVINGVVRDFCSAACHDRFAERTAAESRAGRCVWCGNKADAAVPISSPAGLVCSRSCLDAVNADQAEFGWMDRMSWRPKPPCAWCKLEIPDNVFSWRLFCTEDCAKAAAQQVAVDLVPAFEALAKPPEPPVHERIAALSADLSREQRAHNATRLKHAELKIRFDEQAKAIASSAQAAHERDVKAHKDRERLQASHESLAAEHRKLHITMEAQRKELERLRQTREEPAWLQERQAVGRQIDGYVKQLAGANAALKLIEQENAQLRRDIRGLLPPGHEWVPDAVVKANPALKPSAIRNAENGVGIAGIKDGHEVIEVGFQAQYPDDTEGVDVRSSDMRAMRDRARARTAAVPAGPASCGLVLLPADANGV